MGRFLSWWHARSKKSQIGIAVAVVLTSLIGIGELALRGEGSKTASSAPPPDQPAALAPPALPTLTPTQRASAIAIAQADSRVGPLLRNPRAKRTVVPWTTTRTHELLGAGIDVNWPSPITVSGKWPVLFYDQTEAEVPPYLTTTARVTVSHLTSVHLAVDLKNKRVLGVEPLPNANVERYALPRGFQNTLPPQPNDD